MKLTLFDDKGKANGHMELPSVFNIPVREDIIAKVVESEKFTERQVYGPNPEAGKRHSASGTISHKRHEWKGHYGKGIARLPRKTMWRRGTQFYWVGAEVTNTRGGRASSPPKPVFAYRKINKQERLMALRIAIASTFNSKLVANRYESLNEGQSAVATAIPGKTKDFIAQAKAIFGSAFSVVMQTKKTRPGMGKNRGRPTKSSAGLLVVIGKEEKNKFTGVEVVKANELSVLHLYPLGRLTLFSQQALKELSNVN